ncbi:MAG: ABC transporter ATP-binding protein [Bradyrhizobiaceae bacterium]|nr:ABC transporter ATP-binding protein [Bradyrhizobiaceae bacterium]
MLANDALRLRDVDAYYGDSHALHRVSFALGPSRLLGLLGRNGAGKSTCMNVATGLLSPRAGTVELFGAAMTRLAPEDIAARGVALVPQGRRIFKSLTVRENLTVAARRGTPATPGGSPGNGHARPDWTLEGVFDMFPRLGERRRQIAVHLSGGEQQMLAIGRALMANPRVLLLDEPSEGLAPQVVAEVMATIRRLKEGGLSIVLVEQNPKLVFGIADDIVVLNSGHVVAAGTAAELRRREDELRQHLGVF